MISRAQRILFVVMLVAAVTMAAILIRLRERAQDRLRALQVAVPVMGPVSAPPESVAFLIPNDTDGSLLETRRSLPMPQDESAPAISAKSKGRSLVITVNSQSWRTLRRLICTGDPASWSAI